MSKPRPLLTIFARYPVPGEVKTRLADGIGMGPACALYRACVRRILHAAGAWANEAGGQMRICTAGPADDKWRSWLGSRWECRSQSDGDLGRKMATALHQGLSEGYRPVLCVGTDVPGLEARQLKYALQSLRHADAVIGPSIDGGYYLVGINKPAWSLFTDIPWSTGGVLGTTRAAALKGGIHLAEIAPLDDLDSACDLWGGAGRTSVVIPTLNEEKNVAACVGAAFGMGVSEVIVADGGSSDRTVNQAERAGAMVVTARRGRGVQLNAGASIAGGDTLWFIHADCRLDPLALWEMGRALQDPAVIGGAFELKIDRPTPWLKVIEATANLRSRLFGKPYGDQAMFVRREIFEQVGGFPDWPLMEDVEMSRRLRRAGKLVIVRSPGVTSARRWLERGVLRTYLTMKVLQVAYYLGASPESLSGLYEKGRGSR